MHTTNQGPANGLLRDQDYELVPIGNLRPHPKNPRQGDVNAIVESIKANQFYGVCVAQRATGFILVGNHRWMAARQCGLDRIPVVWVDCDDATALRILLADNRTNDLAAYDEDKLAEVLQEIQAGAGTLSGTGYDLEALGDLLKDLDGYGETVEGLTDDDAVPEVRPEPVTRPGDLWLLGEAPKCPQCGAVN
jgi:ParB-like chromosome segregation protein Spo0J